MMLFVLLVGALLGALCGTVIWFLAGFLGAWLLPALASGLAVIWLLLPTGDAACPSSPST